MKLDDLRFINFKVKFYRILFDMARLPVICLCCFFSVMIVYLHGKQMMLQVIELLLSGKLDDEIILVEI